MHVRSGDTDIFWITMGQGPDVVLLHPFPSSHEFWLPVAEALTQKYRVTLLDLRGHGLSGIGEEPATMQKHAADVAQVCKEAAIGRAIFAGVSIGGYVLFEFWRTYRNQVRGLVLADTRAQADNDETRINRLKSAQDVLTRGPAPYLESMLPKLLGGTTLRNRPDIVADARKTMVHSSAAGIAAVLLGMAERPDSSATLKTLNVPTLVMVGEEEPPNMIADAQFIHHGIRKSEFQVVPKAGHYAVFEDAQFASRAIRQFLDKFPP